MKKIIKICAMLSIGLFLANFVITESCSAEVTIKTDDHNKDGRIDTWKYFEDDEEIRNEIDRNFADIPDFWMWFENERKLKVEGDFNFDGKLDLWNYIEDGMYISKTDRNYDGIVDLIYFCDDPNWIEWFRMEIDNDLDGKPDMRCLRQDSGEILCETDINQNEKIEKQVYFKDKDSFLNFRPYKVCLDNKEDGVFDVFAYYKGGKIIKVEKDTNSDGTIDTTIKNKILLTLLNFVEKIRLKDIKKELGIKKKVFDKRKEDLGLN